MHYSIPLFYEVLVDAIESVTSKTPEEIAVFFKEEGISPVEAMALVNEGTRAIREEEPDFDPRIILGGVTGYLNNNGFIYDEGKGKFREK
ncbi:hypothetical protein KY331_02750 [Candidatus Woesearchaeota archaeon]|nr:hypothetical protein [Candidatus Woesearchaeota archaeon]